MRRRYGTSPFALRIPVAAVDRAAAEALLLAWRAEFLDRPRPGMANPRRARNISLGVMTSGVVLVVMALNAPFMTFSRMIYSGSGVAFFLGGAIALCGLGLAISYHRAIR